ncbi:MAG: hypothetical protein ACD_44C00094G0003 [uncultured bacterium]|nr:MAG: hypothetical protein ACD_44C00094G0003 [uncultured bacterium]OGT15042.1 MAG: hypothetical protein A3B69_05390 [Gammaproteobacteria bacterium RIFCSPHIGHO2_02_FULL_38_33]OGT24282.1 MAG: hypothetical protein A2W47_00305 [Gammaproteobacteria bacterium RIFCSPHIGHO2_12_38_15]OGT67047.1 MAG: hypothetical protein A3I12_06305 [Gammaproteobacteria bacterium RIFCSPLOWO2_02_FULL_38_11]OGT77494.1 MAG: hypothetical protein A3G71_05390 [Gammaproteobacteria bacterium RIFCSPLOWO2_12_FULL_38_14]
MLKQPPHFVIQEERLYFEGDFTFQTVLHAWRELKKILRKDADKIIFVNFEHVNHIDSACFALLLAYLRERRQHHKLLKFEHIPDKMLALAKVSGIEKILFSA